MHPGNEAVMKNKIVLVIEDNPLNMKLVRTLIELEKHRVFTADNAEQGLQLARDRHPDLILMDIQMPGMDGLEATRLIKNDPDMKDIPVVVLTSFAMPGDEDKAINAGCDGYITKPVDTREFYPTITRYFRNTHGEE